MEKIELISTRWLSLEDLPSEVWKPTRFKNYVVSNYGRVKRLAHITIPESNDPHAHHRTYSEKMIKLGVNRCGYVFHRFSVNGKLVNGYIHQLVAEAFIPNPKSLPFINHKNENKSDNRVENLEYCNAKFNSNYGTCQERRAISVKEMRRERIIDVDQYDKDGNYIRSFHTKGELDDGGFLVKTVLRCCRRTLETSHGYVWRFKGEPFTKPVFIDSKGGTIRRKIDCFTLEGEYIRTFDNLLDAAMFMGGKNKRASISECANGKRKNALGYIWKYKTE